jgi:outer membrane protein assembly factor BamA
LVISVLVMLATATFANTLVRTSSTNSPQAVPSPTPTPLANASAADDPAKSDKTTDDDAKRKKKKRGTFIPAPIPITSPTFGSGIILGLGYVFQIKESDKLSPPSTIGGAVAFTNSGTRGAGIGANLNFGENKYKTTFAIGKGRASYDFYGVGRRPGQPAVSVRLNQSGGVFFAEFMRNVWKDVFIGPRYQYRKLTVHVGGTPDPGGFVVPTIDLASTTASLGFHIERDLRDSSFYPTKGSVWAVKADFFAKPLGSNRTYQVYKAEYNGYHQIGKKQVLAYRGSICSVSDRAPFFDLCLFGSNSDLRGYTTGQFQNHRMFATQIEYRRELPYRLGIVGFVGVGGVARYWKEFRINELLPAGGVGLRFKLDKKNHINYRIDWGYGRAGHTLSMSVTEAF